jgi:transposase
MERVTLTQKELKRVKVMERVVSGDMSSVEASESLGVTCRQLRRLKSKYIQRGEEGLIHGNRDRKPKHALPQELKMKVLGLFEEKYSDSNFCHCSELLEEHEGIKLSPSSIGRILKSAGKKSKRAVKRRPKKHQRRERRAQEGMLWQADATPYEWLGKGKGYFALHAVIDDATGIVTGAIFAENECAKGYSVAMKEGIKRYGIPLGLYTDKHTIFRSPKEKLTEDEELDGVQIPLSNFGKAMAELHIEHIKANTPQAKGRVERLWETLQDRLPVELRLLGVKSMEEANEALPRLIEKHNKKYAVIAEKEERAYRELRASINLDQVFSMRETRKIGGGNSISYKKNTYVPCAGVNFAAKTTVEVRESYTGEVFIWYKGQALKLRKLEKPLRREEAEEKEKAVQEGRKGHKPSADHPWRRGFNRQNKCVNADNVNTGVAGGD